MPKRSCKCADQLAKLEGRIGSVEAFLEKVFGEKNQAQPVNPSEHAFVCSCAHITPGVTFKCDRCGTIALKWTETRCETCGVTYVVAAGCGERPCPCRRSILRGSPVADPADS